MNICQLGEITPNMVNRGAHDLDLLQAIGAQAQLIGHVQVVVTSGVGSNAARRVPNVFDVANDGIWILTDGE
jgi:hypothetical protein